MTKFSIKGELDTTADLDQFDALLALLVAIQNNASGVETFRLRGRCGDVKLRISREGEWSDG